MSFLFCSRKVPSIFYRSGRLPDVMTDDLVHVHQLGWPRKIWSGNCAWRRFSAYSACIFAAMAGGWSSGNRGIVWISSERMSRVSPTGSAPMALSRQCGMRPRKADFFDSRKDNWDKPSRSIPAWFQRSCQQFQRPSWLTNGSLKDTKKTETASSKAVFASSAGLRPSFLGLWQPSVPWFSSYITSQLGRHMSTKHTTFEWLIKHLLKCQRVGK